MSGKATKGLDSEALRRSVARQPAKPGTAIRLTTNMEAGSSVQFKVSLSSTKTVSPHHAPGDD